MTIILCSDCKKPMSNKTICCPKCGKPNPAISPPRSVGILLGIGIFFIPYIFAWFTLRKGHSINSRLIAFSWLAFIFFLMRVSNTDNPHTPPQTQAIQQTKPPEEKILTITASTLANAYNNNSISADQNFKGVKYKVSGTIADIGTDILGDPFLTLKGGVNEFMEPIFKFKKSSLSELATLRKGLNVVLICEGDGDMAKIPLSINCTLQ